MSINSVQFEGGNLNKSSVMFKVCDRKHDGGGIHGSSTTLEISETVSFIENSASNGGGLSLASGSLCLLRSNTTVYLRSNHAEQYGGAIFVADEPVYYCTIKQPT